MNPALTRHGSQKRLSSGLGVHNCGLPEVEGPARLASTELELKLLNRLISMGLSPGREILVISRGRSGVLVEVDNSMIFVSRGIARLLSCEVDDCGRQGRPIRLTADRALGVMDFGVK